MLKFSIIDILLLMTLIAVYVPAQSVHSWAKDAVWESHGAFGHVAKFYSARPLEMTLEGSRQYCEENGLEWEIYATKPTVQGVVIRSPKFGRYLHVRLFFVPWKKTAHDMSGGILSYESAINRLSPLERAIVDWPSHWFYIPLACLVFMVQFAWRCWRKKANPSSAEDTTPAM